MKNLEEFDELAGHIQAMLKRSDTYQQEAEADGDIPEGEKHARVSCVLRELGRLATCIRERTAPTPPPPPC